MGKHALRKGLSSVNSIHRTTPVLPGRTVDAPEHIEIFDSSYAVIIFLAPPAIVYGSADLTRFPAGERGALNP